MRAGLGILLLGLFLLLVLVRCNQRPKNAERPTPISSCPQLADKAHPYSALGPGARRNATMAVAALAFSGDGPNLWIAYVQDQADSGQLVQVQISYWQVLRSLELAYLNTLFTRFNGDATLLASVSQLPCPTTPYSPCVEPRVWETDSGALISSPRASGGLIDVHDIAFTGRGDWLVAVIGPGLDIIRPTEITAGLGLVLAGEELERIVVGTINASGDRIVYGTDRKSLELQNWDGHSLNDMYSWHLGAFYFDGGRADTDAVPLKLAISPNDRWLAVRSVDGLELRDASAQSLPQYRKTNLENSSSTVIEFNPSSSLLAAGSSQHLQVFSIPTLNQLLDKPNSQVTAIAFSPDGCQLAWGDVEGTVHIITAPNP